MHLSSCSCCTAAQTWGSQLPSSVTIYEVGPRDGLQNEPAKIDTAVKVAFINALADAGCKAIEATSFVSPKWVPQLADAADVLKAIDRRPGVLYPVLTPNLKVCTVRRLQCMHASRKHGKQQVCQCVPPTWPVCVEPRQRFALQLLFCFSLWQGLQNAIKAGAKEVAIFAAASNTFSQTNINCSVADSLKRFEEVAKLAADNGVAVRG